VTGRQRVEVTGTVTASRDLMAATPARHIIATYRQGPERRLPGQAGM
jgi:hypothetical protein